MKRYSELFLSILNWLFSILFFSTPLLFFPLIPYQFSELFEIPKMFFVYIMTLLIVLNWCVLNILSKKFCTRHSALTISLLLILLSNILSTIFSIDIYSSIFGYPTRLHGGLLSLLCYVALYFIYVGCFERRHVVGHVYSIVLGSIFVSLYGIAQKFGVDSAMWNQSVQTRVFSTLGQPNWLAAYCLIIIFLSGIVVSRLNRTTQKILYSIITILAYMSLLFSGSRSGIIGLIVGTLSIIVMVYLSGHILVIAKIYKIRIFASLAIIAFVTIGFIQILNSSFRIDAVDSLSSVEQSIGLDHSSEGGQIRLLVWKGALTVFKNYPIFGSGVETFTYSFYANRPAGILKTSESSFLYNKAHNEFLHILATLGIFGLVAYLYFILNFLYLAFKSFKNISLSDSVLGYCLIGAFISLLTTNFFGFSVVSTSLLFFVICAFFVVYFKDIYVDNDILTPKIKLEINNIVAVFYVNYIIILISFVLLYLTSLNIRADLIKTQGIHLAKQGNIGAAFVEYKKAYQLTPYNPWLANDAGYTLSFVVAALKSRDVTDYEIKKYAEESEQLIERSLDISPGNVLFWRKAAGSYFNMLDVNRNYYSEKVREAMEETELLVINEYKTLEDYPKIYREIGDVDRADKLENYLRSLRSDADTMPTK